LPFSKLLKLAQQTEQYPFRCQSKLRSITPQSSSVKNIKRHTDINCFYLFAHLSAALVITHKFLERIRTENN